MFRAIAAVVVALWCALVLPAARAEDESAPEKPAADKPEAAYTPQVAAASNEGELAIKRIRVPEGLQVRLFAAEPLLANPVAFTVDERGRFYVAETFRLGAGVTDIRGHMDWLDDDLASRTVDDRVAMYKKRLGDKFDSFEVHHDRIRLVEDRDGDGRADAAEVFADGFHHAADGLGAGVLTRGRNVWYTCIPDLWLLRDTDGDGRADERRSLSHGYGVHVGFIGHDLHGLRFGPDGKLYFSIGDRGLNVPTPEGVVAVPDCGAVLRCDPDGSRLEVFATGLRNPQELAFDPYGNLFTGDNNSDGGDRARFVYVVEGGDSGWRIGYQFMNRPNSRGPWNAEKMWHPPCDEQPAFLVPPLANLANGPSGLCYDPGTGLPPRYRGHFFLCDFRGSAATSGIYSFALAPKGAAFELADTHEFAWSAAVTDVDFGVDGGLYFTDWVDGWGLPTKGRIYRVSDTAADADPLVSQVKELIAAGMNGRPVDELVELLSHPDQRVRQPAQFALAALGPHCAARLNDVAARGANQLARIHAIWALGQIASGSPAALDPLVALAADGDAEIRAQVCRVLGDHRVAAAFEPLVERLRDDIPRVRFFAALGLSKLARREAFGPVVEMLRENADRDPYLRHAGVMALCKLDSADALLATADDPSPAVRMGVLLAWRRTADPRVAHFLADAEPKLVAEAVRAVNDVPIPDAMPQLAAIVGLAALPEPAWRRAINANFRLGEPQHAAALAALAARGDVPDALRVEALRCLDQWEKPSGRDRLTGLWRPLAPRPAEVAAVALRTSLGGIFAGSDQVRQTAARLAAKLGIQEVGPELFALAADGERTVQARVDALRALDQLGDARRTEAVELALADAQPGLRAAAQRLLAHLEPERALTVLGSALDAGSLAERQSAFGTLAEMKSAAADAVLARWLDRLCDGNVPAEVQLDLLAAAEARDAEPLREKLARYEQSQRRDTPADRFRESLAGGDAERGRRVFFEKAEVYCQRCHKAEGRGGEVGPDLSKIGGDPTKTRAYLLESIVDPNRQIAKGFDSVVLATVDGRVLAGILKSEDDRQLRLVTAEGKTIVVDKDEIEERNRGQSAMPDKLIGSLSKHELRDLVEFLSTLK